MEEDYRLFQLVKRNPINNCVDLSKNMIGKRDGVFYFTQHFRIDFENKMHEIGRLKEENENLLSSYKQLEEENRGLNKMIYLCTPEIPQNNHCNYVSYVDIVKKLADSIPKSKVKEKIEGIKSIKTIPYESSYTNARIEGALIALKELLGEE